MATRATGAGHRPVERKRLTDLAHDAIRDSITSGRVKMGERLIETQLSEELGMSRAPIREALRRLAEEGLAVDHAHYGASVATLTAADIADLYNVRVGLEIVGLRGFVRRGEPLGPLEALVARMHRAAARSDRPGVVRAEFEFHRHIAEHSGNALVAKLFGELQGLLMLALHLDDESFQDLHEVAEEHEPIVEAIAAGDERRAVLTFEEHLVSTVGDLVERLDGDRTTVLPPLRAVRRKR